MDASGVNNSYDTLEMDLERLLDAAMDSMPAEETLPNKSSSSVSGMPAATSAAAAETMVDPEADTQPELGLDLELELEAMMEDSGAFAEASQPTPTKADSTPMRSSPKVAATQGDPSSGSRPEDLLENEFDALLSSQADLPSSQAAPQPSQAGVSDEGDEEQFWEDAIQTEEDNSRATLSVGTPAAAGAEGEDRLSQRSPMGSTGSQEVGLASQMSQESTIEMALERIIDDALA